MNNDEKAKTLGFENEQEMLLYRDVTCNDIIYPEIGDEDYLSEFYEGDKDIVGYRKIDYLRYINKHGLSELFETVKNMPLLDRLVEIYKYNANGYSLCKQIRETMKLDYREAAELFDGEKQVYFREKFHDISFLTHEYNHNMWYIETQAKIRIPDDYNTFEDAVEQIRDNISSIPKQKK